MQKSLISKICIWVLVGFCALSALATTTTISFNQRKDVQNYINMMVVKYHFDRNYLNQLFAGVQPQPQIVAGMSRTAETLPWYRYQAIFITQKRIDQGLAFWNKHAKTLATVEKQDGVPASIIVAIVGVETYYGQHQGNYRVLDSLATLAFDYPPRATFFQSELTNYLLLVRENHLDATKVLGSYAGAIGQAQFMPSSYRNYAIDYRNTGSKDLSHDVDDVIASVGNYFKQYGWQQGGLIVLPATTEGNAYRQLPTNDLKPNRSIRALSKAGVIPSQIVSPHTKATLLCLETSETQVGCWVGFDNFYVLSRYNPRVNYAMAVFSLSQALEQKRSQENSHTLDK